MNVCSNGSRAFLFVGLRPRIGRSTIANSPLVLFSQLSANHTLAEVTILDLEKIVAQLQQEMERIGKAIGMLEQSEAPKARRGRPPGSVAATSSKKPGRKGLTPAGRKRLSEMMKKRWAERRNKQA